jgi:hypothetical protein
MRERHVLLIYKGCDVSICQLSTFEYLIAREAQQNLRIDAIRAHESPVICEWLGGLVELSPAEGGVRAWSARSAREAQQV